MMFPLMHSAVDFGRELRPLSTPGCYRREDWDIDDASTNESRWPCNAEGAPYGAVLVGAEAAYSTLHDLSKSTVVCSVEHEGKSYMYLAEKDRP